MCYCDIGMFFNSSYKDTIYNVFKIEYEDEKRTLPIDVYIKCSDKVVELHKKDTEGNDIKQLTPEDLKEFLGDIQTKFDEDSKLEKHEEKLGKEIDMRTLLRDKIEQLEGSVDELKICEQVQG